MWGELPKLKPRISSGRDAVRSIAIPPSPSVTRQSGSSSIDQRVGSMASAQMR